MILKLMKKVVIKRLNKMEKNIKFQILIKMKKILLFLNRLQIYIKDIIIIIIKLLMKKRKNEKQISELIKSGNTLSLYIY